MGLQMPRRHELHILMNYVRDTSDHRSPHEGAAVGNHGRSESCRGVSMLSRAPYPYDLKAAPPLAAEGGQWTDRETARRLLSSTISWSMLAASPKPVPVAALRQPRPPPRGVHAWSYAS